MLKFLNESEGKEKLIVIEKFVEGIGFKLKF